MVPKDSPPWKHCPWPYSSQNYSITLPARLRIRLMRGTSLFNLGGDDE